MLRHWLNEFANVRYKCRTEQTQANYCCKCRKFLAHLGEDPQPQEYTAGAIAAFIAGLQQEERRPRTVRSYFTSLRAFGKWMVETGRMSANPGADVKAPRLDRPRRAIATHAEILAMLEAAQHLRNAERSALALAVVATFVYSGARRQELLDLCVDDIDFGQGLIHIRHGKGDKPRDVAPHQDCLAALAAYLKVRPPHKSNRLFILRGRPMEDDGLRALLAEVLFAANLPGHQGLLPHGLRHSVATRLHRANVELDAIREFLGHSSIVVTAQYLHSGPERIKEIAHLTAIPPPPTTPEPPAPAPAKTALRLLEGGAEQA